MKKIEIVLNGRNEEQIAQHIMKSVYEAINEYGYCDISLYADTIPEPKKEIQIPSFLTQYLFNASVIADTMNAMVPMKAMICVVSLNKFVISTTPFVMNFENDMNAK